MNTKMNLTLATLLLAILFLAGICLFLLGKKSGQAPSTGSRTVQQGQMLRGQTGGAGASETPEQKALREWHEHEAKAMGKTINHLNKSVLDQ